MTAICGILHFDSAPVAPRDIERILNSMPHRMPHRRRVWCGKSIGLGHGLLRVTQEDLFESQPAHSRDNDIVLVADARLDNRDEIAAAVGLGEVAPQRMPDSMLLLAAYELWGERCAEHLLGDFAFAIFDTRSKKLVLGRDHMGQRPLFYHLDQNFFIFATEIKGLWTHPDVPRTLSDASIGKMLIHDMTPTPGQTLYDGVFCVPGATVMTISTSGEVSRNSYWEPHADPVHLGQSEAYYVDAYRAVLGEAVACRLRRAEGTPGLIFSGGYDSSAIAGLAGSVLNEQSKKLTAVSSTMPADYTGTIHHARHWVELCARDMSHLDLHQITREGRDPLKGFERGCHLTDGPPDSYYFVEDEIFEKLSSLGARVVMDGHGGDYTLNPRGQPAMAYFLRTGRLLRFLRELRPHMRVSGHSLWRVLKDDLFFMLLPIRLRTWIRRLKRGTQPVWSNQPIAQNFAQSLIAESSVDSANLRLAPRARSRMRDQITGALRLVSSGPPGIEIHAAIHGLSMTRPFHDKRVVELALAVPEALYVKNGRNRHLACEALKDLYPVEFQTPRRLNDDEAPDFQSMAKRIEPQVLTEMARMEKSAVLSHYVDFPKIRRLLAARGPEDHDSGWEQETHLAMAGFLAARYIEWFRRDNR